MGDVIAADDIETLRPVKGICASEFDNLVGKTCLQDVEASVPLSYDMFS